MTTMTRPSPPVDPIGVDLTRTLRALKLGGMADTLPERLMTEPLSQGGSKGQVISEADLKVMLDEYYRARGWDPKTGIPKREKLMGLGLDYVAEQLKL